MNRQQWAILATGVGGILLLSVMVTGGEFNFSCVDNQCDESFAQFLMLVLWTFFAIGFGSILLIIGIILFVIDATHRPPSAP